MTERAPIEQQIRALESLLETGEIDKPALTGALTFLRWCEANREAIHMANEIRKNPIVKMVKDAFPGAEIDLSRGSTRQAPPRE